MWSAVWVLVLLWGLRGSGIAAEQAGPASAVPWQQQLTGEVFAFYYLWYGDIATDGRYQHWDHEVLPHWNSKEREKYPHGHRFQPPNNVHSPYYPLRGPYSSSDPKVIRQHIQEMLDANITAMVVSWWGPEWRSGTHDTQGVNTDKVLQLVVHEVEQQQQLKIAFHLEPYEGRTVATIREDIHHLMERYNKSTALLHVGGKPVYFMYDSYRIPRQEWADMLAPNGANTVRGTEWDGVFIALLLDLKEADAVLSGGFDGFYTYFASEVVSPAGKPENWPGLARWANEHKKLFIASIGPGYDDSRIRPWNEGATRSRETGARSANTAYWLSVHRQLLALLMCIASIIIGMSATLCAAQTPPCLSTYLPSPRATALHVVCNNQPSTSHRVVRMLKAAAYHWACRQPATHP
eukprot:GHUV01019063.1.p1 GENE.GHUV01019063.1~~GHUV01019063.1.p1  ORF type:complete len:407 (+),score=86.88 GHUV01019063.1:159-1379(+)